MEYSSILLGIAGLGLAILSIFLPYMGIAMPLPIVYAGVTIGFLLLMWTIPPIYHKLPVAPVILIILCCAGISSGIAWIKIAQQDNDKIAKQISSKLLVSVQPIYSTDGFLTLKMTFSNNSDKQCIIEFVHLMTLTHASLIELNKNPGISLDNNYNDMFEGKSMMSIVAYPFLEPKPNLPKRLAPHELWLYETKEPFNPLKWLKSHELEGIKRIPIGLSIQFIDFTGSSRMISFPFFSELSISEDGRIHGNHGSYQRRELLLD